MANTSDGKGIILPVRYDGKSTYDIRIEDSFDQLGEQMLRLSSADHRICIVTDSNVCSLYLQEAEDILKPVCRELTRFIIPAGEEHKNLMEVHKLYDHLVAHSFERTDFLVALGGGVIGDMTGFAAATYMRGIRFVQIPTTLLSQVDSSIGGKTGVDLGPYKNMVGCFYQPALVYINIDVLKTLSDIQFSSGMGEVLKHGLIRDADYYEYMIDHMDDIENRDNKVMKKVVEGSCRIKRAVVERDPTEKGNRALLNFGHTIGHAVEMKKNFALPHGHCVSMGCVAAAYISWKRGLLEDMDFAEIRDMMVGFHLPISFDGISSEEILEATKHDKKMVAGQIRFVLLKKIGSAFTDTTVTDEEMLEAINFINGDLWGKEQ